MTSTAPADYTQIKLLECQLKNDALADAIYTIKLNDEK